jgi:predicted dehydrogenase
MSAETRLEGDSTLKAGVVGIGHWGSKVANEYVALMQEGILESVHLYDSETAKLERFAGNCKTFNDFDKFLEDIDMVHICTPNSTHYEVTRKALEANVNVLVEKPMADDVDQAFDLVELSMKRGAILQVGHIFRFANVVRRIKELFENREFGDQFYFNIEWTHLMPPIRNVDVIYDLLPHPLDIINFISGKWPIDFGGVSKSFGGTNLAEAAFIQAVYDGFFANIHLSWVHPTRNRKLELVGSEKSVVADCVNQTAKVLEGRSSTDLVIVPNNTIRDEIVNFLDSIKTGKSDYNSSIVGARTIQMINEVTKSMKFIK